MRIFVSYSVEDVVMISEIVAIFQQYNMEVDYWGGSNRVGEKVWDSIFSWVDRCDVVLAVITDSAVKRGISVGNEIGRATAKGKKILPLIGENVHQSELGCLQGVTYQKINSNNIADAVHGICKDLKVQENQDMKNAGIGIALIAGICGLAALLPDDEA